MAPAVCCTYCPEIRCEICLFCTCTCIDQEYQLLIHAPWLSWLQRPTVIPLGIVHRKVVSSILTGAVHFSLSFCSFHPSMRVARALTIVHKADRYHNITISSLFVTTLYCTLLYGNNCTGIREGRSGIDTGTRYMETVNEGRVRTWNIIDR